MRDDTTSSRPPLLWPLRLCPPGEHGARNSVERRWRPASLGPTMRGLELSLRHYPLLGMVKNTSCLYPRPPRPFLFSSSLSPRLSPATTLQAGERVREGEQVQGSPHRPAAHHLRECPPWLPAQSPRHRRRLHLGRVSSPAGRGPTGPRALFPSLPRLLSSRDARNPASAVGHAAPRARRSRPSPLGTRDRIAP